MELGVSKARLNFSIIFSGEKAVLILKNSKIILLKINERYDEMFWPLGNFYLFRVRNNETKMNSLSTMSSFDLTKDQKSIFIF